jgi:hypothetical protein
MQTSTNLPSADQVPTSAKRPGKNGPRGGSNRVNVAAPRKKQDRLELQPWTARAVNFKPAINVNKNMVEYLRNLGFSGAFTVSEKVSLNPHAPDAVLRMQAFLKVIIKAFSQGCTGFIFMDDNRGRAKNIIDFFRDNKPGYTKFDCPVIYLRSKHLVSDGDDIEMIEDNPENKTDVVWALVYFDDYYSTKQDIAQDMDYYKASRAYIVAHAHGIGYGPQGYCGAYYCDGQQVHHCAHPGGEVRVHPLVDWYLSSGCSDEISWQPETWADRIIVQVQKGNMTGNSSVPFPTWTKVVDDQVVWLVPFNTFGMTLLKYNCTTLLHNYSSNFSKLAENDSVCRARDCLPGFQDDIRSCVSRACLPENNFVDEVASTLKSKHWNVASFRETLESIKVPSEELLCLFSSCFILIILTLIAWIFKPTSVCASWNPKDIFQCYVIGEPAYISAYNSGIWFLQAGFSLVTLRIFRKALIPSSTLFMVICESLLCTSYIGILLLMALHIGYLNYKNRPLVDYCALVVFPLYCFDWIIAAHTHLVLDSFLMSCSEMHLACLLANVIRDLQFGSPVAIPHGYYHEDDLVIVPSLTECPPQVPELRNDFGVSYRMHSVKEGNFPFSALFNREARTGVAWAGGIIGVNNFFVSYESTEFMKLYMVLVRILAKPKYLANNMQRGFQPTNFQLPLMIQTHVDKNGKFHEWLDTLQTNAKKRVSDIVERYPENFFIHARLKELDRKHLTVSVFPKTDEVLAKIPPKPRMISNVSPAVQAIVGPAFYQVLKSVKACQAEDTDFVIPITTSYGMFSFCYSYGCYKDADGLSAFYNKALQGKPDSIYFDLIVSGDDSALVVTFKGAKWHYAFDVKKMDTCQTVFDMWRQSEVFRKTGLLTEEETEDIFLHQSLPKKVYFPAGGRMTIRPKVVARKENVDLVQMTRDSGSALTTFGNSTGLLIMMYDIIERVPYPKDPIDFQKNFISIGQAMGYEFVGGYTDPWNFNFLKGFWYLTDVGYRWGPSPSRLLKLFKRRVVLGNVKLDPLRAVAENCASLKPFVLPPPIRKFVDRMAVHHSGEFSKELLHDKRYKVQNGTGDENRVVIDNSFWSHYGVTPEEVLELSLFLQQWKPGDFWVSDFAQKLIDVDYA